MLAHTRVELSQMHAWWSPLLKGLNGSPESVCRQQGRGEFRSHSRADMWPTPVPHLHRQIHDYIEKVIIGIYCSTILSSLNDDDGLSPYFPVHLPWQCFSSLPYPQRKPVWSGVLLTLKERAPSLSLSSQLFTKKRKMSSLPLLLVRNKAHSPCCTKDNKIIHECKMASVLQKLNCVHLDHVQRKPWGWCVSLRGQWPSLSSPVWHWHNGAGYSQGPDSYAL